MPASAWIELIARRGTGPRARGIRCRIGPPPHWRLTRTPGGATRTSRRRQTDWLRRAGELGEAAADESAAQYVIERLTQPRSMATGSAAISSPERSRSSRMPRRYRPRRPRGGSVVSAPGLWSLDGSEVARRDVDRGWIGTIHPRLLCASSSPLQVDATTSGVVTDRRSPETHTHSYIRISGIQLEQCVRRRETPDSALFRLPVPTAGSVGARAPEHPSPSVVRRYGSCVIRP